MTDEHSDDTYVASARPFAPPAEHIASQLPSRGDKLASLGWTGGVVTYVLLVIALLGGSAISGGTQALEQFVGHSAAGWNYTVLFVVALSLVITVYVLYRARRDIAFLHQEEQDVEWMARNGAARKLWILLPLEQRKRALEDGVEPAPESWRPGSLLSERVRRVLLAMQSADGSRPAAEQLRFIAESRTGAYGQNTRYAASLLLLLTVLGTFSGVKTALPNLIEAVKSTGADDFQVYAAPLAAVAEAFGSNSFALIGAIALGMIAQGFSAGRLLFLERLELVSEEVLYTTGSEAAAQPLVAATLALGKAAKEMKGTQSTFEEIAAALDRLDTTTNDAFANLQGTLAEIGSRSDEEFFRHSAKLFEAVELRLGRLEDAMAGTASAYGSLVADLNVRTVETRSAAEALARANDHLAEGLARHADVAETLSTTAANVREAAADIGTTVKSLHEIVESMKSETAGLREDLRRPRESIVAELEAPLARLSGAIEQLKTSAMNDTLTEPLRQLNGGFQRLAEVVESQARRDTGRAASAAGPVVATPSLDHGTMTKEIVTELRSLQSAWATEQRRLARRMNIDVVVWTATLVTATAMYLFYSR
jgi:predicted  nucleic acid-binding Zn-ribbon protein